MWGRLLFNLFLLENKHDYTRIKWIPNRLILLHNQMIEELNLWRRKQLFLHLLLTHKYTSCQDYPSLCAQEIPLITKVMENDDQERGGGIIITGIIYANVVIPLPRRIFFSLTSSPSNDSLWWPLSCLICDPSSLSTEGYSDTEDAEDTDGNNMLEVLEVKRQWITLLFVFVVFVSFFSWNQSKKRLSLCPLFLLLIMFFPWVLFLLEAQREEEEEWNAHTFWKELSWWRQWSSSRS